MRFFWLSLLLLLLLARGGLASVSNPHLRDQNIDEVVPSYYDVKKTDEQFPKRKPKVLESRAFSALSIDAEKCPLKLKVDWETEVNAGVVASPVIYPFFRFACPWNGLFFYSHSVFPACLR